MRLLSFVGACPASDVSQTAAVLIASSMAVADASFNFQDGAVQATTAANGQVSEVDLGQVHHNTLNVNLQDVLAQPLEVTGIAGDAVELFTGGASVTSSVTQVKGQTYQAYDLNRDGQLDLLVQQAVMVNLH